MCGANPHPLYYKEEEMIIMCKVMLNSIDKVKEFVNKTSRVDGDVFLQSGRYVIDAKSIMGIFSLDLTNRRNTISLEITITSETESSLSDLEEVMHMEQITRHLTLM